VSKVLKEFGMQDSKAIKIPTAADQVNDNKKQIYHSLIGFLMCAMIGQGQTLRLVLEN
jgi:hypothetical protein